MVLIGGCAPIVLLPANSAFFGFGNFSCLHMVITSGLLLISVAAALERRELLFQFIVKTLLLGVRRIGEDSSVPPVIKSTFLRRRRSHHLIRVHYVIGGLRSEFVLISVIAICGDLAPNLAGSGSFAVADRWL